MSHKITIAEVAETAHQAEIISRMLENQPHHLEDFEVTAIAALLARLTGNVAAWLMEEQAQREAKA